MTKLHVSSIGFLQALGVLVYCGLINGLFWWLGSGFNSYTNYVSNGRYDFLMMVVMLILMVLSVAVIGLLIFGYFAYLILNKKVREALSLLGFTFLYIIGFIMILIILLCILL